MGFELRGEGFGIWGLMSELLSQGVLVCGVCVLQNSRFRVQGYSVKRVLPKPGFREKDFADTRNRFGLRGDLVDGGLGDVEVVQGSGVLIRGVWVLWDSGFMVCGSESRVSGLGVTSLIADLAMLESRKTRSTGSIVERNRSMVSSSNCEFLDFR